MAARGVLALLEQRGTFARLGAGARGVIATLGLLAVAGSVGLFSSTTPFPGKAAVLPVLWTVMVILGGIGDGQPAVTRLLAQRGLVRVGLISYPLYLWHWPLMVLALRLEHDPSRTSGVIAILAITFLLSDLTYRFVETPIRDRKWLPSPRSLVLAAAACALPLTIFGIHTYSSNGAAYRFAEPGRSFLVAPFNATIDRCGTIFRIVHPSASICTLRSVPGAKQRVLLWGNSHADMWTGMLRELAEKASLDSCGR